MFKSQTTTISAEALKAKTDKLKEQAMKEAKEQIRKGELLDCRSLGLCLKSIDAKYEHVKLDVRNSNHVPDYTAVRASKIAETRQLLEFYDGDYAELTNLYRIVESKAKLADCVNGIDQDRVQPPDIDWLKSSFVKLTKEEEKPAGKEKSHDRK